MLSKLNATRACMTNCCQHAILLQVLPKSVLSTVTEFTSAYICGTATSLPSYGSQQPHQNTRLQPSQQLSHVPYSSAKLSCTIIVALKCFICCLLIDLCNRFTTQHMSTSRDMHELYTFH